MSGMRFSNVGKSLVFGLMAGVLLALTPLPLSAGWLEESGLSFIDAPKTADVAPSFLSNLDLSLVRDGTESALRVPLGPAEDARDTARFARFMPYLSVGASLFTPESGRDAASPLYEDARNPRKGMEVGAGLTWKLFERVELFGEYRFLHVNPDPAESAGAGMFRRDLDGPTLKGGINIRLP
jgi:hypothetical protein